MARLSFTALKSIVAAYVDSNKISVDSFTATKNNTVELLDTIAKIYTNWQTYQDKLDIFDGEDLTYGKTIEEWAQDLIEPQAYDSTGAGAMSPHDSTYRPVSFSFTLGRKKIPQTIRNNDIERAVHNIAQFSEIISGKTKSLYDSETVFKYAMKRQALGVLIARAVYMSTAGNADRTIATEGTTIANDMSVNQILCITGNSANYLVVKPIKAADALTGTTALSGGFIVKLDLVKEIAAPVDDTTGEAFIKQVKADVEVASDNSEGHSLNGNTLGASTEAGLVLVTLQGIMPSLEVDTMAGAFNQEHLALPAVKKVVPDFGNQSSNYYAILIDRRAMRLHNTYRAVRENANGDGDFLNLFYHIEYTAHISKNVFVRIYKKP